MTLTINIIEAQRVLQIDTYDLDFVKNEEDYRKLISCILAPRKPGVYQLKP